MSEDGYVTRARLEKELVQTLENEGLSEDYVGVAQVLHESIQARELQNMTVEITCPGCNTVYRSPVPGEMTADVRNVEV